MQTSQNLTKSHATNMVLGIPTLKMNRKMQCHEPYIVICAKYVLSESQLAALCDD